MVLAETSANGAKWYRVELEVFDIVVESIKDGVLKHIPCTTDLSNLTVKIRKPDTSTSWLHVPPHAMTSALNQDVTDPDEITRLKKKDIDRYLVTPLYVILRLQIEYWLPSSNNSSNATKCGIEYLSIK